MQVARTSPGSRPQWQQWGLLLLLSLILVGLLELAHIPAAFMLGPMFASMVMSVSRSTISVPRLAFKGGQAIIGCLIAASLTPEVIRHFFEHGWLFLSIVLSTLLASSIMGYAMARMQVIPGSTAIWGTTPGAAATMVIMAAAFGSDFRLVAIMQYLRVLIVVLAATVVAAIAIPDSEAALQGTIVWFPPLIPSAFISTLLIAFSGILLAHLLHFTAGNVLIPLFIGSVLHGMGWVDIQLPEWLLAISYAVIGWRIGLSFDVPSLRHAYKALPVIVASILILMLFCGFLAWILILVFDIDPLTAYLATSPGGLDTIAIIVASRPHADMSLVTTLQTARLLLITILCPPVAMFLAKRTQAAQQQEQAP